MLPSSNSLQLVSVTLKTVLENVPEKRKKPIVNCLPANQTNVLYFIVWDTSIYFPTQSSFISTSLEGQFELLVLLFIS